MAWLKFILAKFFLLFVKITWHINSFSYVCVKCVWLIKSRYLFPNKYKDVGWVLTIFSLALGIANVVFSYEFSFLDAFWINKIKFYQFSDENFTNELAIIGFVIGLLLLAFSKEKVEDEQISRVRLESLQWSVYLNYSILIFLIISIHGAVFFQITVYNMFTLLVFFLIRFHYVLYKQRKIEDELW